MGPADKDSLWGIMPETKGVSFDAFWMDQTEVTNAKYRQFVYYVRDSIIRERLADPAYGGNDLFKITEDRYGEPVTPHLDWNRPIPWRRANEDEQRAIESVYYTNPVTGEKGLDPKQMIYKYEWYDYTAAALRKNQLNPADRVRNTDIQVDPNEVVMISKDTAYIDDAIIGMEHTVGPFKRFLHAQGLFHIGIDEKLLRIQNTRISHNSQDGLVYPHAFMDCKATFLKPRFHSCNCFFWGTLLHNDNHCYHPP